MELKLKDLLILENAVNIEALKLIDKNEKGFVIVVDKTKRVLGTLTDGDLRRAFIKGEPINGKIVNVYSKNCKTVKKGEFSKIIEFFKLNSIKFLPIVDEKDIIVDVITKSQLHTLLLNSSIDENKELYLNIDGSKIDYEVFNRPWGFYKTTVLNDVFQSKIINIYPKGQLSLQMHKKREEYWIIVNGEGIVQIGESEVVVRGGSTLFIPKGCKHRITNTSEKINLILTEVQIGNYFGEDDIIRFEDRYGRS